LLMKDLGKMDPEERRTFGAAINAVKSAIEVLLGDRKTLLEVAALQTQLQNESIDVTLPALPEYEGRLNPLSQPVDEVIHLSGQVGFVVKEGPDIDSDFHNFTALNIPPDHPALQEQDTVYLPH